MSELNANWWEGVEKSDGIAVRNTKEQLALDFLDKNREVLPPDRFAKLVEQTIEILKKGDIQEQQIQKECEEALKELKKETAWDIVWGGISRDVSRQSSKVETSINQMTAELNDIVALNSNQLITGVTSAGTDLSKLASEKAKYFEEKTTNVLTGGDIRSELDISMYDWLNGVEYSDKGLLGYSKIKGGNYSVTITEFEQDMKGNKSAMDINSKALANYFLYLDSKGQLKPEILLEKFGESMLFQIGQLWSTGGNGNDGGLIAKKTLEQKGMGYIIKIIDIFSSPENFLKKIETLQGKDEQETALLFLNNNLNKIQDAFKKDLKERFIKSNPTRKEEADIVIDAMLKELLQYKDMQGLPKIYKVFDTYNRDFHLGLSTKNIKEKTAQIKEYQTTEEKAHLVQLEIRLQNTTDKAEKERLQKHKDATIKDLKEIEMTKKVNEKVTESDIEDLISGEKTIEKVIEKLGNEDADFKKDYTLWQKEKNASNQDKNKEKSSAKGEKSNMEPYQKHSTVSQRIENIDDGKSIIIPLDRSSENSNKLIIERQGDSYTIRSKDSSIGAVVLTKEKIPAYVESLRFMEKIGLGYFVQNLSQSKLSQILEQSSKDTVRVNNQDGNFDESEKKRILSTFGKILGVDGIDSVNSEDGQKLFQGFFFTHNSIESILMDKGILRNGALQVPELERQISA